MVLEHWLRQFCHFLLAYPSLAVGYAFKTCYLQSLTFFKHFHINGSLGKRIVSASVEPCETSRQSLNFQLAILKEFLIDSSDFQLPSVRGLDMGSNLNHLVGIEIKSHHCIVAFGVLRFFLDGKAFAITIKFSYAITFRIIYPIAKDSGICILLSCCHSLQKNFGEPCSVKDIVTEHKTNGIIPDKIPADYKSLCKTIGRRLLRLSQYKVEIKS